MNLAIGCDEAACDLRDTVRQHLLAQGHAVTDFGTHDGAPVLYPDVAIAVAQAIVQGRHERGILLCGTGIGMAIAANKVAGIRAAQAHDTYSAERASRSNDAQIITLGSRVIGAELAKAIVDRFLASTFDGGGSAQKVDAITGFERAQAASARGEEGGP
ncbi:Ribose-5-phosphate isomerase B [Delftia tsuruhatensis]|uniref:ribose 5-phosphate isomerase B n=1 Tax=Delftia tsuruhatensis TaxID=180282 RepID=UPI001E70BD61|nr:ribose 5-phosphate isomerase B [Delftia tsuruhatensis]CAB5715842.1 Ribose-5-phosphate isomerase B [Delftia tsuruhatensis]CAC9681361.1 Ribose-5-phosphate isomerase B [Delftia tsuruhatensis]